MNHRDETERGWIPLSAAAKYLGIRPEDLKAAAIRGECFSRIKPQTAKGRGKNKQLRFRLKDLDAYVIGYWESPVEKSATPQQRDGAQPLERR